MSEWKPDWSKAEISHRGDGVTITLPGAWLTVWSDHGRDDVACARFVLQAIQEKAKREADYERYKAIRAKIDAGEAEEVFSVPEPTRALQADWGERQALVDHLRVEIREDVKALEKRLEAVVEAASRDVEGLEKRLEAIEAWTRDIIPTREGLQDRIVELEKLARRQHDTNASLLIAASTTPPAAPKVIEKPYGREAR